MWRAALFQQRANCNLYTCGWQPTACRKSCSQTRNRAAMEAASMQRAAVPALLQVECCLGGQTLPPATVQLCTHWSMR